MHNNIPYMTQWGLTLLLLAWGWFLLLCFGMVFTCVMLGCRQNTTVWCCWETVFSLSAGTQTQLALEFYYYAAPAAAG